MLSALNLGWVQKERTKFLALTQKCTHGKQCNANFAMVFTLSKSDSEIRQSAY
jgi:hypothetical protein